MARHKLLVDIDVRKMEVRKKDIVFTVKQNDVKFGELRLLQGAVVWRGSHDQIGRKMGWTRFDQMMQEEVRRAERRPSRSKTAVRRKKRT